MGVRKLGSVLVLKLNCYGTLSKSLSMSLSLFPILEMKSLTPIVFKSFPTGIFYEFTKCLKSKAL